MTDRMSFALYEPVQAHKAFSKAWDYAKAATIAGHRMVLWSCDQRRAHWRRTA